MGLGMEELVADGVILFKADELDCWLFRDREIRKMRGTPLSERKVMFTFKGGFKASRLIRGMRPYPTVNLTPEHGKVD